MRPTLVLVAALLSQVFVLSRAWLGSYAPDPLLVVASFAALYWPRGGLILPVLAVGWLRGLVLLEPAGGQVLCCLVSTLIVSGLRVHLLEWRGLGFVLGSFIQAGCWSMAATLVSHLFGVPVLGGRELVLGAALSIPLAGLAQAASRRVGARA